MKVYLVISAIIIFLPASRCHFLVPFFLNYFCVVHFDNRYRRDFFLFSKMGMVMISLFISPQISFFFLVEIEPFPGFLENPRAPFEF